MTDAAPRARLVAGLACAAVVLLASAGCERGPVTLRGRVVLLTLGRGEIALAGARVWVVREDSLRAHLERRRQAVLDGAGAGAGERAMLEARRDSLRTAVDEALREEQRARHAAAVAGRARDFLVLRERRAPSPGELTTPGWNPGRSQAVGRIDASMGTTAADLVRARRQSAAIDSAMREVKARWAAITPEAQSGGYYLEGMPAPLAETRAGADGDFALEAPRGVALAVVAVAPAAAVGVPGSLCWAVRVPPEAFRGALIVLDAANLASAGSSASLFRCAQ